MSKVAFIFPGQGSQYVGMGKQLSLTWKTANRVFEQAGECLGFDLASLCWNGPKERLDLTEYTQPAVFATSIAALEVLAEHGLKPRMVAGHSLGEYTAISAGGGFGFPDALRLVQNRGRYMQDAVEPGRGAMAAILGLSRAQVEEVCEKARRSGIVSPANINGSAQIVIAGEKEAVEHAGNIARETGAKRFLPLSVSVPSHCELMRPAARRLAADLQHLRLNDLRVPLVANVHARSVTKVHEIQEALVRQLEHPVLWVDSMLEMKRHGIDTFIEVGPGKVLSGLLRRIIPDAGLFHVEDPESLEKTVEALIVNR